MKIPVCVPFFEGDAPMAARILKWINKLGGASDRELFLVTDCHIQESAKNLVINEIGNKWKDAFLTPTPYQRRDERWPIGPNWLFETALRTLSDTPFLWLEPDAIPLRENWMDLIDEEYEVCGKPFMGAMIQVPYENIGNHMSGIAVYPKDAISLLESDLTTDTRAFDISIAKTALRAMHGTKLIQHIWGEMHSPPTFFPDSNGSTTIPLSIIDPNAAIFHRNKDGTLLDALGAPQISGEGAVNVVMPVSRGTSDLALMTLRLMALMGQTGSPLVIVAGSDLTKMAVDEIRIMAQRAFMSPRVIVCKKGDIPSRVAALYAEATWKGKYWMHHPEFVPLSKNWIEGIKEQPEGFLQNEPGATFKKPSDLDKINASAVIFAGSKDGTLQKMLIDTIETAG